MAFFDNFGMKASEATAKAVQKAQELSEITRINSLISEEERKVDTAYFQIGKLYVATYGSNAEEPFSGMINSVLEGESKITNYKKQIQDIKGVQRCPNCGAEVAKGVAFCSACGAGMPKVEIALPEDSVRCEGCGAIVKKGMRFCTSCGKPMPQPAPKEEVETTSAQEPGQVQERRCPNCGAAVESDVDFCTECGTKL